MERLFCSSLPSLNSYNWMMASSKHTPERGSIIFTAATLEAPSNGTVTRLADARAIKSISLTWPGTPGALYAFISSSCHRVHFFHTEINYTTIGNLFRMHEWGTITHNSVESIFLTNVSVFKEALKLFHCFVISVLLMAISLTLWQEFQHKYPALVLYFLSMRFFRWFLS